MLKLKLTSAQFAEWNKLLTLGLTSAFQLTLVINRADYPELNELIYSPTADNSNEVKLIRAYFDDGVEVVNGAKYVLEGKDDQGNKYWLRVDDVYGWFTTVGMKINATRFTADEYPHYKNDFLIPVEVEI